VLRGFLDEQIMASATAPKAFASFCSPIFLWFHSPEGLDGAARWGFEPPRLPGGEFCVLFIATFP